MSAPVVLGLDAGGTSTRALVVDHRGTPLGTGRGGSGNPTASGPAAALEGWSDAATGALTASGCVAADVSAVVVALAGQPSLAPAPALVARLGLAPDVAVSLESDVLAMYRSGADEDDGLVLLAGTGSIGGRVARGALHRLVGGSGWLVGDAGSGFATGMRVARAAVADLDGSGPATALTPAVLAAYGLVDDDAQDRGRPAVLAALVDAVYAARPVALARLAPLVCTTPDDEAAAGILRSAQDELASLLIALRAADPPRSAGSRAPSRSGPVADLPLVLGGSFLTGAVLDREASWSPALRAALDGIPWRRAQDGAVGAAVLALRTAGVHVGPRELETLRTAAATAAPAPLTTTARI